MQKPISVYSSVLSGLSRCLSDNIPKRSLLFFPVCTSGTISRVMSRAVICLVSLSPESSSGQPEDVTGRHTVLKRPCFGWGLHGVSRCRKTGSLLHCLFTLTPAKAGAVLFCCTFPGVTSAGRYPASCPVKPGLSSDAVHKGHPSATACFTRAYHTNYKAHSGVAQEIFERRTAVNRTLLHCCKKGRIP